MKVTHPSSERPKENRFCSKCGNHNHLANDCTQQRKEVRMLSSNGLKNTEGVFTPCLVNNIPLQAFVYPGAICSLIVQK